MTQNLCQSYHQFRLQPTPRVTLKLGKHCLLVLGERKREDRNSEHSHFQREIKEEEMIQSSDTSRTREVIRMEATVPDAVSGPRTSEYPGWLGLFAQGGKPALRSRRTLLPLGGAACMEWL